MITRRLFWLLSFSLLAAGCAGSISSSNDKVIAVVGDKKITYGEFKRQYEQNYYGQADSTVTPEEKERFLNLLVDYNLKLIAAKDQHLAEDPAIKAEMKGYEQQLAVSYVMEHELTDPAVRQIYDRQKYEVRASQVFIPFGRTQGGGVDTAKAYDEAMTAIRELKSGTPLDSLIRKYRGGDTYYITAGNFLQYPGGREFEDLLYSLKPGEVGAYPIRTTFGYLVIRLDEKRPRVESIRASHILIPIPGKSPEDTLKAYNRAVAIMDSIRKGVDFGELAERNSIDRSSAVRGGDLGYFSRGQMVRPFDEAAFGLKVGEIAGPIRTQFGYHIIKLTDIRQLPPFDQARETIRNAYLNGGYKLDLANLVASLKLKYHYKENDPELRLVYGKLDSLKRFNEVDPDTVLTAGERAKPVFTMDGMDGTIDTIFSIVNSNEGMGNTPLTWAGLQSGIDQTAKEMAITHYAMERAHAYPEFDSLIRQYENGILIYHIEQREIWNKVLATDSVLKPYYFEHADRYRWPERVDVSEIHFANDSVANAVYGMLGKGLDFDSAAAEYSNRPGSKEKGAHMGVFADSANALAILAFKMKEGEYSKPVFYEGGYSIIKVNKFVPPQPKTFEEARGEVSSDYQESESKKIQAQWLDSLRARIGVKVDDKTFRELIAGK